mgnify:CR=1 FL=1
MSGISKFTISLMEEMELKLEIAKPLAMLEISPKMGPSRESVKERKGELMKSTVETGSNPAIFLFSSTLQSL